MLLHCWKRKVSRELEAKLPQFAAKRPYSKLGCLGSGRCRLWSSFEDRSWRSPSSRHFDLMNVSDLSSFIPTLALCWRCLTQAVDAWQLALGLSMSWRCYSVWLALFLFTLPFPTVDRSNLGSTVLHAFWILFWQVEKQHLPSRVCYYWTWDFQSTDIAHCLVHFAVWLSTFATWAIVGCPGYSSHLDPECWLLANCRQSPEASWVT